MRLLKKTRVGSWAAILAIVLACPFASHAEQSQAIGIDVFAPGVISSPAHDSAPAFTPSGTTVYFGRSNAEQSAILVSQRKANGQWGTPQVAPFSGEWNDMEPAMAPDGSFLVFVSDRPDSNARKPVEGFFNGKPQKEPYARACDGDACNLTEPITVADGSYYMVGDNRGASDDSRFWGPVPKQWILGRAERCSAVYFFCSPA